MPEAALPRRKRPTQREVAGLAGVSQAAVSQVLNGGQSGVRIPDATRQRVLDAMHQLGYVPNVAAQRLAGGRNRILGVFTYEPVFPSDRRDFFSPFLEGIEAAAAELDYDLLLHTRSGTVQGGIQTARQRDSRLRLADGTVMMGQLDQRRRRDLARLIGDGHAVTFIGRRELPGCTLSYVTADYAAATRRAVRQLAAHGHRKLLYVGAEEEHESAQEREQGYRQEMASAELMGETVRRSRIEAPLIRAAMHRGVTGYLFENEHLAAAWVDLAQQSNWTWPGDFGFAVLGDPIYQTVLPEGWAHFQIPRMDMGRQAIQVLSALLDGDHPPSRCLPCRWVAGTSLG
ncbi:LacI family DNA-binding transcriptional regulator [Deinococcus marmoris]|uniref:Transcriptional regulator, LacI family n=1 Tax=Deinococcus marmoris TaxID=249408 RepID=A0A1U7NVK8_9DEIO|nr:LacI family DNA-binding transcriptional regulator [Deinococcus marmoris]OLV16937.1 Transcriptional regulator, LacI family [Deinococcus marmoris]